MTSLTLLEELGVVPLILPEVGRCRARMHVCHTQGKASFIPTTLPQGLVSGLDTVGGARSLKAGLPQQTAVVILVSTLFSVTILPGQVELLHRDFSSCRGCPWNGIVAVMHGLSSCLGAMFWLATRLPCVAQLI